MTFHCIFTTNLCKFILYSPCIKLKPKFRVNHRCHGNNNNQGVKVVPWWFRSSTIIRVLPHSFKPFGFEHFKNDFRIISGDDMFCFFNKELQLSRSLYHFITINFLSWLPPLIKWMSDDMLFLSTPIKSVGTLKHSFTFWRLLRKSLTYIRGWNIKANWSIDFSISSPLENNS